MMKEVIEENKLAVIVKESGLESTKAQVLLDNFSDYFKMADDWDKKAKAIVVTNAEQTAEMKMAREGRLFLRAKRIEVENKRKELKEQSLREGKAIDGIANVLKAVIVPVEEYLEKQEKFVEIQEDARKEQLKLDRIEKLSKYGVDVTVYDLKEMDEAIFNSLIEANEKRIADEKQAEADRIAKEKKDAEDREKMRIENERLKKETEEKEAQLKKEREDAQKKLDEERKAKEDELAKQKKEIEDKAKKQQEEREKKMHEEQEKWKAEQEAKAKKLKDEADKKQKELEEKLAKEKKEMEYLKDNQIKVEKNGESFTVSFTNSDGVVAGVGSDIPKAITQFALKWVKKEGFFIE